MARKFNVGDILVLKETDNDWNVRVVNTFEYGGIWYYEVECLDVSDIIRVAFHREVPESALVRLEAV